jgi:hypothetical protein
MLWQTVEFGTVSQKGDIAERRSAIDLLACGDVSDCCQRITIQVVRIQPHRLITATRHSFGRIQSEQVPPCDPVQNTPHFPVRIGPNVGWCGLSPGPAFKIEAQPIADNSTNATFERPDAASLNKCSHVHVGPVCEVPDFVGRSPTQHETMPAIVPARHEPRPCKQSSPTDSHVQLCAIDGPRRQTAFSRVPRRDQSCRGGCVPYALKYRLTRRESASF